MIFKNEGNDSLSRREFLRNNYKFILLTIVFLSAIISVFDFHPDLSHWLLEILRNIVMVSSITITIFSLVLLFRLMEFELKWRRVLATLFVFVSGGIIGGLIGWGINVITLGFNVSSFWYFVIKISMFSIVFGIVITIFLSLYQRLKKTIFKLSEKEVSEEKLKRLFQKSELHALRAKVNPHFLFNTLNSISSLVSDDPAKAEEMIQKLSNLFRHSLSGISGFVKLSDELRLVEEYLEIEKIRFGKRLQYEIKYDENLKNAEIPGMLIQPIVENSIKHGISQIKDGGKIFVKCCQENNFIKIIIADTGSGFKVENPSEGFGLSSVRERLNLLYQKDDLLDISSNGGVKIKIRIPLKNT